MLTQAEWEAIQLTILISVVAVLASLPFAIATAWIITKKQFPGKALLEVVINLPLVLPPVVTGYLLIVTLGKQGLLGGFLESMLGLRFVFDWKGAALASAVVSFPLLVRPIRLAFEQIDNRLVQAARTLGAKPWDAFLSVSLPMAKSGIYAGCLLAFARSMGEFGATIMIAGNIPGETQTISLMIYSQLDSPNGIYLSSRLVVASILLSAMALWIGERIEGHRRQRLHGEVL